MRMCEVCGDYPAMDHEDYCGSCRKLCEPHKYVVNIADPDGKKRRFTLYLDVPVQRFERGRWKVTIQHLRRSGKAIIDKIEWEEK